MEEKDGETKLEEKRWRKKLERGTERERCKEWRKDGEKSRKNEDEDERSKKKCSE